MLISDESWARKSLAGIVAGIAAGSVLHCGFTLDVHVTSTLAEKEVKTDVAIEAQGEAAVSVGPRKGGADPAGNVKDEKPAMDGLERRRGGFDSPSHTPAAKIDRREAVIAAAAVRVGARSRSACRAAGPCNGFRNFGR
jgi:hypothetical protein